MLFLARRVTKIIALALDLDGNYFDHFLPLTTYPGADLAFNCYPPVLGDVGKLKENEAMAFMLVWEATRIGNASRFYGKI
jgi:hypothetical protein